MNRSPVLIAIILACSSFLLSAQTMLLNTPNVSPKAAVEQTIGLTIVRIDYHRPAVQDREIWGELVPYNTPWRAGANENTTISFSQDVQIEGRELPAGTYGLHLIPREGDAELIFSNNATSWGSYTYQATEDALRVTIPFERSSTSAEFLTFYFEDLALESATCVLQWGNGRFPFRITTEVHEVVLAGFRNDLRSKAGWTWQGWHEAANYCLANEVNIEEGLGWATRSVYITPNANNMITKARLTTMHESLVGEAAIDRQLAVLSEDLARLSVTWKEYLGAANYAQQQGKKDQAMQWLDQSIGMHATMTNLMAKHDLLVANGEAKKAAKLKEEALSNGSNAELNTYAYRLMWSGKTAEAVEVFEANANRNPEDPNVWDSLGEGYIANGQNDKAEEALRKSLSLNPPDLVRANSLRLLQSIGVDVDDIAP